LELQPVASLDIRRKAVDSFQELLDLSTGELMALENEIREKSDMVNRLAEGHER